MVVTGAIIEPIPSKIPGPSILKTNKINNKSLPDYSPSKQPLISNSSGHDKNTSDGFNGSHHDKK